jgi:Domain of unknown function (DUF4332)/Carboxypeptidase regulatory-like domain
MESRLSQLSRPVVALEGIGKKLAGELEPLDIVTIGDLLRVEPGRIHAALNTRRSLDQVRSWLQMARFMQIRAMTPQWAEALSRSRVYTPRDLFARDLPALQKLFAKAKADGMISDVPSAATIGDMMKEAAEIEFTGAVNGTVLDQAGAPVEGADVRIGREHERSDARGRFRIVGIPLWANSTLAISHEKYRPATFRLREVDPSFSLRSRKAFIVRRLLAGEAAPKRVLMEVNGDVLPPIGDARVGQREVERDALEDGDIFAVTEFSPDRKRCKLSSKLLAYEDGEFWVRYVWMPVSDLNPGAKSGDTFVLRHGAFEPIAMSPVKLRGWPAILSAKRQIGPPPATADETEAWLEKGAALVQQTLRRRERH